jgi:hypothetical protein
MNGRLPLPPAALSVLAGIVSWELVRHLGGNHREAWDDPVYWQLGYLSLLVAAFLLGAMWREQPWRWGVLMMAGQAIWSLEYRDRRRGRAKLVPLGSRDVRAAVATPHGRELSRRLDRPRHVRRQAGRELIEMDA